MILLRYPNVKTMFTISLGSTSNADNIINDPIMKRVHLVAFLNHAHPYVHLDHKCFANTFGPTCIIGCMDKFTDCSSSPNAGPYPKSCVYAIFLRQWSLILCPWLLKSRAVILTCCSQRWTQSRESLYPKSLLESEVPFVYSDIFVYVVLSW